MPVSRPIATLLLLLFGIAAAHAGGSISLAEVMEQLAEDDKLIAEIDAALTAQNLEADTVICSGRRFGNHWENLGGARAIPYECEIGSRTIEIDGELHVYDKDGNELGLEDDNAPHDAVAYKQLNLTWSWQ